MSFRVLRILASAGLAAASLCASSGEGLARDSSYRRPAELEPLHHDNDHEIIFEMEPMHPVRRAQPAARAVEPPPAVAKTEGKDAKDPKNSKAAAKGAPKTEPVAAKPADAPKSTQAPKPVEAQKPVETAKQAEAPKSAEPVKPAEAAAPETAAAEPAKPEAPATAEAPKAADVPATAEAQQPAPVAQEAAQPAAAQPAAAPAAAEQLPAPPVAAATAEQAPAAAPVADPSQPVPLPLEQALAPNGAAPATQAQTGEPAPVAGDQAQPAPVAEQPAQPAATPAETKAAEVKAAEAAPSVASLLARGVKGPAEVRLADKATMFLPAGRIFIAEEPARELAKQAGLDWRPTMHGLVAPAGETLRWLAPVEVLEDGYVKSDIPLEADKLFAAFSAGLPEVNAQRAKAGQPAVELAGWLSAPAMDEKHRVSACVDVVTKAPDGDKYFNCESWALGRDGAIKVSLAEGGEEGARLKGETKSLAETIVFDHGKTYEEIDVAADKAAPYSVADLLTSDVAAKAAPAPAEAPAAAAEGEGGLDFFSLLAKLWKVILFAVVAAVGVFAWMRRKSAREEEVVKQVEEAAPQAESLFAKLLPSLHAKFAKRNTDADKTEATAPVAKTVAPNTDADKATAQTPGSVAAPAVKAPSNAATKGGALGGLIAKITNLRGKASTEQKIEPAVSNIAESVEAIDDVEPASALKKLAARMRRQETEQPVEKVDVSRALRGVRVPSEAPEAVQPSAPRAPAPMKTPLEDVAAEYAREISREVPAEPAAPKPAALKPTATESVAPAAPPVAPAPKTAPAPAFDDGFGLVEPGDAAATSAAMHARESLRQANG